MSFLCFLLGLASDSLGVEYIVESLDVQNGLTSLETTSNTFGKAAKLFQI